MKFLHTMLRVTDLAVSIKFYTNVLGMSVLDRTENSEYRYTLVFVGYKGQPNSAAIELTCNWDINRYDMRSAFGHIALGVEDIYKTCSEIASLGGNVTRPPGPVKGGNTHIAFIKDPDNYQIELIQMTNQ